MRNALRLICIPDYPVQSGDLRAVSCHVLTNLPTWCRTRNRRIKNLCHQATVAPRFGNGRMEEHKKLKGAVMRLDGKRVVVIGGSSGIGLETARLALSLGAYVTIAGRSEDRLSRAAATLKNVPDRLRTVVADMADGQSIPSLFSR